MSILFLDQFNQLGGAQQCLLDLIDGFEGEEIYAALPGAGPLTEALRERGVAVYELPPMDYTSARKSGRDFVRFPVDVVRAVSRIRGIVDLHTIDLIYVNGPRLLPAAAMTSPRMVFHAHSYLDKRYASVLARWCLRSRHARVIASSRFVAGPLPRKRLRVIYNGVRELPYQEPRPKRPFRIGMLGRIAPEKGQLDFVRAARTLTSRGVEAEFSICGAPLFSSSDYFHLVRQESEGLPIVFPGWTDNVARAFACLDLLAVPSASVDATPRVIMEAFSAGVPVIAYPSGGIPELIEDGVTGVLTTSLAGAIEELLGNPERMHAISRAARCAWEGRFTVERYVRDVREFVTADSRERSHHKMP